MPFHAIRVLEIAAGAAVVAGLGAAGAWMFLRKRPSAEEQEVARRQLLTQSGRLVDGTLLDVCEIPAEDGRTLTMLLYGYRIGGVDYECTQDVSTILNVVDVATVRAGFPCSVRYQPGNPQKLHPRVGDVGRGYEPVCPCCLSVISTPRWTGGLLADLLQGSVVVRMAAAGRKPGAPFRKVHATQRDCMARSARATPPATPF